MFHHRSLNWQCDTCGKVVDLLSKNTVKKPITVEEQTMLNTIALKVNFFIYYHIKFNNLCRAFLKIVFHS